MKKTNITYWIITGLFCAFMLFSAIPDLLLTAEAKTFMNSLGYTDYFTRFIGFAKILGVIAILIPGYPKIKEWAYAGLVYDLVGATYSIIAAYGFQPQASFMFVILLFCFLSYYFYTKKMKYKQANLT